MSSRFGLWPRLSKALELAALLAGVATTSLAQFPKLNEYIIPPGAWLQGFASNIVVGPDSALWFTDGANARIGRITTTGNVLMYQVRPYNVPGCGNCGLYGIALGPDGALWFTDPYANKIGRITTNGIITEYALPVFTPWVATMDFSPEIVSGPDGAMWFTWSPSGNYYQPNPYGIGRITMNGAVTWFTTSGPTHGITVGSDGALWFCEPFLVTAKIGRISTAGVMTEYPEPNGPERITAGPDGAIWFTTQHSIGRISTAGTLTEYPVPWNPSGTAFVSSDGITLGPGGLLWFTRYYAKTIGRVTMDGIITDAIVSGITGDPTSIILGPDGALWFGESQEMGLSTSPLGLIGQAIFDTTPPVFVPQISGSLGNDGWYRSDVNLNWSVTDPESGIASSSGCNSTTFTTDTAGVKLTCSATNGAGLTSSAQVTIKIDKTPPVTSGMPAAGCSLWPPNHKLVQVADVKTSDALSGIAPGSFKVTGISNEPSVPSDPNIVITPDGSGGFLVQLRADRLGTGNGRVYTINATAMDNAGNSATATSVCTAPHDQGH